MYYLSKLGPQKNGGVLFQGLRLEHTSKAATKLLEHERVKVFFLVCTLFRANDDNKVFVKAGELICCSGYV